MTDSVRLTTRATRAAQRGRAWFFADDLQGLGPESDAAPPADGALVTVLGDRGAVLGLGLYAAEARIRLRSCGGDGRGAVPTFEEWFRGRLAASVARRGTLAAAEGVRLVHAEADGIPGLVVDRYADVLVVQMTAAPLERHRDAVVAALVEVCAPRAIVGRHDLAVREKEGLPRGIELLHGERVESVEIDEDGLWHTVRPFDGHKTGFYLDQRPARARVRALAAGRRVLDLFSYQGGFALSALAGGASGAIAVDQSADALARARTGAERNGLQGLELREANAFDVVRELRQAKEQFDLIVLDPPPFAKSKREARGGARGYRDLNRHAARLLAPGGLLLTCSCSHHVTPPMFEDLLRQATAGLRSRVILRERLMAGADHPVWLALPESEYLKSYLLERVDV